MSQFYFDTFVNRIGTEAVKYNSELFDLIIRKEADNEIA